MSIVISGGWDAKVKFWQWSNPQQINCYQEIYVASPVHYMSGVYPLLVTAHQSRLLHVWDLSKCVQTNNWQPLDVMDTALKYATSSIQCFPDGKGFCVGSIEGRCSVKFCDFSQSDRSDGKSFCFKCHRKEDKQNGGTSLADVYSVNGFCFNKKHDTFYSYGGNGEWVSWNKDTRAKYKSNAERMIANQIAPPIVAGD